VNLRTSLDRLERVAGTPTPPPPPSEPDPRDVFWERIRREEIPRMSAEERYWLYLWLCWQTRGTDPGAQPAAANVFLRRLGLTPFDTGDEPAAAG
jgi:hypothetical protein